MEPINLGVVLKVRDLQTCRIFYRDVVGLGAPLTDSNFWVEFSLGDGRRLCLDATPGETVPGTNSGEHISWIIQGIDYDGFVERNSSFGYEDGGPRRELFGYIVQEFKDPEGNPFYISTELLPPEDNELDKEN